MDYRCQLVQMRRLSEHRRNDRTEPLRRRRIAQERVPTSRNAQRLQDHANGCLVDAMLPQEVARGICTVNFEALGGATVFLCQAHVVKHGSYMEQFGIELQFLPQSRQRAEIIDSGRMMEQ